MLEYESYIKLGMPENWQVPILVPFINNKCICKDFGSLGKQGDV